MIAPSQSIPNSARAEPSQLPNHLWGALRDELVDKVAEGDWLVFQARCVREFGSDAGLLLRELVHKTGRSSHLYYGWFYKTRDELLETTGLGNRGQEKARSILTGARAYNGKTCEVLEEHRVSRREPMHYRVDLWALAAAFGCELPDPRREAGGHDMTPPHSESPRGAAESPRGTTESPREATESPNGATSEGLSEGQVIRSSRSSLLQSGDVKNQNGKNPEEQDDDNQPDKRYSEDSPTPPDSTAGEVAGGDHPYEHDPEMRMPEPEPVKQPELRGKGSLYYDLLASISDPDTETGAEARRYLEGEVDREEVNEAFARKHGYEEKEASVFDAYMKNALDDLEDLGAEALGERARTELEKISRKSRTRAYA